MKPHEMIGSGLLGAVLGATVASVLISSHYQAKLDIEHTNHRIESIDSIQKIRDEQKEYWERDFKREMCRLKGQLELKGFGHHVIDPWGDIVFELYDKSNIKGLTEKPTPGPVPIPESKTKSLFLEIPMVNQ